MTIDRATEFQIADDSLDGQVEFLANFLFDFFVGYFAGVMGCALAPPLGLGGFRRAEIVSIDLKDYDNGKLVITGKRNKQRRTSELFLLKQKERKTEKKKAEKANNTKGERRRGDKYRMRLEEGKRGHEKEEAE